MNFFLTSVIFFYQVWIFFQKKMLNNVGYCGKFFFGKIDFWICVIYISCTQCKVPLWFHHGKSRVHLASLPTTFHPLEHVWWSPRVSSASMDLWFTFLLPSQFAPKPTRGFFQQVFHQLNFLRGQKIKGQKRPELNSSNVIFS